MKEQARVPEVTVTERRYQIAVDELVRELNIPPGEEMRVHPHQDGLGIEVVVKLVDKSPQ